MGAAERKGDLLHYGIFYWRALAGQHPVACAGPKREDPKRLGSSGLQPWACSVMPVEATGLAFDNSNLAQARRAGQGIDAALGRRPTPTQPLTDVRRTALVVL